MLADNYKQKKTPKYILKLISISIGFSFGFLILELIARSFPATKHFSLQDQFYCNWIDIKSKISERCIFKFYPNRKGRYTKGKIPPFPIDVIKKTNDIGQFSSVNFKDLINQDAKSSLQIISIGDSFVEALQVNNDESFHGILNSFSTIDGKKVISSSIGKGGDAFAQYLLNVQYVSQRTEMKKLSIVIPIISNDFDNSIFGNQPNIPGAYFEAKGGKPYKFKYLNYERKLPSKVFNTILSKSSLSSYLYHHLDLSIILHKRPFCFVTNKVCLYKQQQDFKANIVDSSILKTPERYREGFIATDIFLENIAKLRPSQKERTDTLFVIDGDRFSIYNGASYKSEYFLAQRNYFIQKAKIYGFTLIDMEEIFKEHFRKNNKKFEFINDGHWNSLGHKLVADTIAKELKLKINKN